MAEQHGNTMIPEAYLNTVLSLLPALRKPIWCRITGNSMAPLLCHGDILLVQPGNRNIHTGDVIVFKSSLRQCAHRAVGSIFPGRQKVFLTKGDNAYHFDRPVFSTNVLGKVLQVRGANGTLRLDSARWRFLNLFIAMCSYVEGTRHKADTPFCRVLDRLFTRMRNLYWFRHVHRQDFYRYLVSITRSVALERRQTNGK
ncbi:MAG: S24/S26 family peptidase [Desulfatiglandales bacterium]